MPRKKSKKAPNPKTFRTRAEKAIGASQADITEMKPQEVQHLVYELQIRQIELELQNEELRKDHVELADSRDRYSDLFEFAPVGYLTLNKDGKVLETNLTAANMLGIERRSLLRANILNFVASESQDDWYLHRQAVFSGEAKDVCEIRMLKANGTTLAIRLESIVSGLDNGLCWTALSDISERKAAEKALHELNATLERRVQEQTEQIRLQAEAIAHLGEGVLISEGPYWLDSRFRFVNEALCRITGYAVGELKDQQQRRLNGTETDGEAVKQIEAELSKGNSCLAELIQYRKDGTAYHAEISVTPLRFGDDRLVRFVSIHRDITERKRSELALRESEKRFRQMADYAPVMIWISGLDKLCTWFNKPWLEFTGRTIEQEIGNGWADGVHPEDLTRWLETYGRSFDAQQPFTMEYRHRRHDGQFRWVLNNGVPLYQEAGDFVGYIGSCIDVTERRKSEEDLRDSEDRIRTILDTAVDSIITIDRSGTIVTVNPASARMFGYAQDELVGQNVELLMPSPYHEEHDSYMSRYLETGSAHIIGSGREVVGLRKDGSTFPCELTVSEISHLGLFTGIHRDISARKQAERQLDKYRKDLQTMSSELLLAEERERQQLAQDLHDGLGQALSRARMKIDQSVAKDEGTLKEVSSILEDIARMVNTLTFELSPPVLHQLGLRPAIAWLGRDMNQRYGLSLQLDVDGQDIPIEERVAVVVFRSIRELLINIAKHAETSLARMSLRRMDRHLQIVIHDQGKGFDLSEQSHRVEAGHFGLFSIRERLEYLGGSLNIQSAPGKGTKVKMTVPLATKAAKAWKA